MSQDKCNVHPRVSEDVVHLQRIADPPKCKINYGLRRKSSLIEQTQQRRSSIPIYTARKDEQTTWLNTDTEVIGIENKHMKEMGMDIKDFFNPHFEEVKSSEAEPEIDTTKQMERVNVSDVFKVLELQSGLGTANNVMDRLSHSKISSRRIGKSISAKLFHKENVKEIDYSELKKLKSSRGFSETSVRNRIAKKRSTEDQWKKRDSPRKIFLSQPHKMRYNKMEEVQVESTEKDFIEADPQPVKDREPNYIETIKQFVEDISGASVDCESLAQNMDKELQTLTDNIKKTQDQVFDNLPAIDEIEDISEINISYDSDESHQDTQDKWPFKETYDFEETPKPFALEESKNQSKPLAAVEPKSSPRSNRRKKPFRSHIVLIKKQRLPRAQRAVVIEEPERVEKFDINLEDLVFPEPEYLSSLIPSHLGALMDLNIDRESAMRTFALVERAQRLRQEYEKRLVIEKYLDALPDRLNDIEAEFAQTICGYPMNQLQEIDKCPCGVPLTQCRALMPRPKWINDSDSLANWLMAMPPAVLVSIFIICIFSICMLAHGNHKPMTTWDYMMNTFHQRFGRPTKTFRSNFF